MKSIFLILVGIVLLQLLAFDQTFAQGQNPNMQVEDPSFFRESMQTGETITVGGNLTAIIIEGLGTILIIVFIVIYAIKKRMRKEPK